MNKLSSIFQWARKLNSFAHTVTATATAKATATAMATPTAVITIKTLKLKR